MTEKERKKLKKVALDATPGPWCNCETVKKMFGYQPIDWWYVYAKRPDDDEFAHLPDLVCKMAGHRATKQEMEKARFEQFNENKPWHDPGQAGKDARYIATWNPQAALDLLQDLETGEMALADAEREIKRLWEFVCEVGKALRLHEDQLQSGSWPLLATIRNELERTLENNEYLGQTAYFMGYHDGQNDMERHIKGDNHE